MGREIGDERISLLISGMMFNTTIAEKRCKKKAAPFVFSHIELKEDEVVTAVLYNFLPKARPNGTPCLGAELRIKNFRGLRSQVPFSEHAGYVGMASKNVQNEMNSKQRVRKRAHHTTERKSESLCLCVCVCVCVCVLCVRTLT